jgi:hypothetical protein
MQITFVKEVNKGAFKCTVDVMMEKWGNFIIRRIKVFQKGSEQWINFPSESYEKDGETKYYAYNMFKDQEMSKKFEAELLKLLKEYQPAPRESSPNDALYSAKPKPSYQSQPSFNPRKDDNEVDFIL